WSTQIRQDFSLESAAASLHAALAEHGEEPPYVTVGHSIGALYVRAFQAKYPDEVSGMVLLDGSSPRQLTEVPDFTKDAMAGADTFSQLSVISHTGLIRLYFAAGGKFDFSTMPDEERREMEITWSSAK